MCENHVVIPGQKYSQSTQQHKDIISKYPVLQAVIKTFPGSGGIACEKLVSCDVSGQYTIHYEATRRVEYPADLSNWQFTVQSFALGDENKKILCMGKTNPIVKGDVVFNMVQDLFIKLKAEQPSVRVVSGLVVAYHLTNPNTGETKVFLSLFDATPKNIKCKTKIVLRHPYDPKLSDMETDYHTEQKKEYPHSGRFTERTRYAKDKKK